jgi:hypothetical protein
MQLVRVYKGFLDFYSKSACWALRASCISFEWASSFADSGYAKSEDPMGHILVMGFGLNWTHGLICILKLKLNLQLWINHFKLPYN